MRVVKDSFKMILLIISILASLFLMEIGYSIGLFMTSTIFSLIMFAICWTLYKFGNELSVFINPNFSDNKRKRRKRKINLDCKVIKKARKK